MKRIYHRNAPVVQCKAGKGVTLGGVNPTGAVFEFHGARKAAPRKQQIWHSGQCAGAGGKVDDVLDAKQGKAVVTDLLKQLFRPCVGVVLFPAVLAGDCLQGDKRLRFLNRAKE